MTAARGTEGVLRDELRELGLRSVKATRGGVHFGGGIDAAMRVCLHTRIGVRVLLHCASFAAPSSDALYEGVRAFAWERVLDAGRTLAVRATLRHSALGDSGYVARKVKDAVVDRLRARAGARPDVDRRDPDVPIAVHVNKERAQVYLDVAGRPLHLRGYRRHGGEAPLKETLAAALLRLSGWNRDELLIDPMCGSGTLAIEAALWAARVAPGALHERPFAFERWRDHDPQRARAWVDLWEEARAMRVGGALLPPILASDLERGAVERVRGHAERAGVAPTIRQQDVRTLEPPAEGGILLTNPPYGVRLRGGAQLERELAEALRRMHGFRVCVLSPGRRWARLMRVRPAKEHTLWNGSLECRFFAWDLGGRWGAGRSSRRR